ncbi:uncharacterized protein BO80DRAFT_421962 [Aspergillus ibericus CBS 121593]|uniref:Uncharacterized protein n=1 Tax=Aspergillus ibericus CBS 121593 TaxID=1448316 RepID=A0A395H9S4_9EURO|nr:hypothetical protein BO80DRAFT_421962 [Aspergillus ibericus CBS 121593]RAL04711.1 hypothetical protein BO80DRAFT_421962 [Aspergillus ibericus CBS 121593]
MGIVPGLFSSFRIRAARLPKGFPGARKITSTAHRFADKRDQESSQPNQANGASSPSQDKRKQYKAKSVAQADQELRERLEQMSGGGGAAGIEYEDGKPNAMKRSVRNNMFRYI